MKNELIANIGQLMNWQTTQYNHGVSVHSWGNGGGFYVDAPDANGTLNCIIASRPAYAMNKRIVIRYYIHKMSGNPVFKGWGDPVPGGLKPNFRPMLTRGGVLNDRWYPSGTNCGFLQTFDKALGLIIPIKPAFWQDVYGTPASNNPGDFRDVVTHGGSIAIVFGWQNYFAHGLYVANGHARFGLWDCVVTV